MDKQQIYNLLLQFFPEAKLIDTSTFCKIIIGDYLQVFTYSGLPESKSIWYLKTYFSNYNKEVEIPNKNSKEFLQIFKEIYLDVIKSNELIISINQRLDNISDLSNIRDIKIDNIIND